MNFEELSPEEIDLIKQYRRSKAELNISIKNEHEKYWDAFENINLKFIDGKMKIATSSVHKYPKGHEYQGQVYSGCGYFSTSIPKEELEKIRDFINYVLE